MKTSNSLQNNIISELLKTLESAFYTIKSLTEDYDLKDSYKQGLAVVAKVKRLKRFD